MNIQAYAARATVGLVLMWGALVNAEEFPYRARVTGGTATVYAGPGQHYYDTAELPVGAEVEVYEHTASGFCAVRPPEGSFSWLPMSALRVIEPGMAEVTRADAPARVGSLLHDRRDAVHVRLDLGERVKVLAKRDIDGVSWAQIAPPSGEFRWIEQSHLKPIGDNPAAEKDEPGWVQAAAHTEPTSTPDANETGAPSAEVVDAKPLPPAQQQPAPALKLEGDFAQQLAALEVNLARQVAELPTLWRLEPIEQQAAQLMAVAKDDNERQAVRDFATRVDRFATIANRYKSLRGTAPPVTLTKTTTPNAPSAVGGYDAVGTLRPVVSQRPGAPQYALVDAEGKIVSFVTAPTGMNLSQMLGQRVGVQGAKGFMPEYQQDHLTAGRVTPLGGVLR